MFLWHYLDWFAAAEVGERKKEKAETDRRATYSDSIGLLLFNVISVQLNKTLPKPIDGKFTRLKRRKR